MDRLPERVLKHALSLLPQVDVFRNLRVCRWFRRILRPQLATLALDELELVLQFREHGLPAVNFSKMTQKVVEVYGRLIVKLELKRLCQSVDTNVLSKNLVLKIADNCPNLVELSLETGDDKLVNCNRSNVIIFPSSSLHKLPKLKVLRAVLTYEYEDRRIIHIDKIVDQIFGMSQISNFQFSNYDLIDAVSSRNTMIPAVRGIHMITPDEFKQHLFPSVEEIWFNNVETFWKPKLSAMPSSLKNLKLSLSQSERAPAITDFDLEPLKYLVNLTGFTLSDWTASLQCLSFLRFWVNLENLSVLGSKAFDANAFALIPETATLKFFKLLQCPAICKSVFSRLIKRNRLEILQVIPIENLDDAESLAEVVSCHSVRLREVYLSYGSEITDSFLEQLSDESVVRLTALSLDGTGVTASGIQKLLTRRHNLIQRAKQSMPGFLAAANNVDSRSSDVVQQQSPLQVVNINCVVALFHCISVLHNAEQDRNRNGIVASGREEERSVHNERHSLFHQENASRLPVPRSLMRIAVDDCVAEELSREDPLIANAMVYLQRM